MTKSCAVRCLTMGNVTVAVRHIAVDILVDKAFYTMSVELVVMAIGACQTLVRRLGVVL